MISSGNDINNIPFVSNDDSCILCTASYFFMWEIDDLSF